jgi:bifunctional DNA-binding transcriptional regulator/antitoxin component of YhaV-PrlF toxin-antitoxin module
MAVYKQVDSRGNVVLPKEMRDGVDLVEIERRADGVIELRPKVPIDQAQAWFWTERWQKMEAEADADIAAGRVKRFDGVDELFDDLDS